MQQSKRKRLHSVASLPVTITAILSIYSFSPPSFYFSKTPVSDIATSIAVSEITGGASVFNNPATVPLSFSESKKYLYDTLKLEATGLSRIVFEMALRGMEKLKNANHLQADILSIADFSKSSTEKRLFVIDLDNGELVYNTWVAHGRNSGEAWASSFSNKPRSKKSSLGFYITGPAYQGTNGYSLKLAGMEKGFNSNALQRAIVVHGADYVNTDYINSQGYIGRSQGCPAVAPSVCRSLINTIKEGSCLFIYYPSPVYLKRSALIR